MASRGRTVPQLAGIVSGRVVAGPGGAHDVITDVTHDSRQSGPGMLFVAVRGATVDGHNYVEQASAAGSPAACVEVAVEVPGTQIVVSDTRSALGLLAAEVHDHPSHSMAVIGVTGTNGKTTVTHYLESLAISAGVTAGLIGTIHTRIGGESVPAAHTTPEASDFQRLLARMRDAGAGLVAAEVSSHALTLGRVVGTRFAVAAFTNLSQDHLDFHGDMASYRDAKRSLFADYEVGTAVMNIDDEAGRSLASSFGGTLLTVGDDGDVRHVGAQASPGGTDFTLVTPWGSRDVSAPVISGFNLDNAVLAAGCALATGMDLDTVAEGMSRLAGVPGRFEVISAGDPIRVVIDYAHTPDGISRAIEAGRGLATGRVIALIGAGGDRDRDKRPLMGAAVSAADLAIITSDNPRSEAPEAIARAVAGGVDPEISCVLEIDRRTAIEVAVGAARDGDVVLILGRGHESHQEIAGEKIPFDDRLVARAALERRRSAGTGPKSGSMGK